MPRRSAACRRTGSGRGAVGRTRRHRLDKLTLVDGRVIDYAYTADQLTGVTAPDGRTETYGYDTAGRMNKVTDARRPEHRPPQRHRPGF
ncbi:RHS repeat domain-containing protein [Streptomyces sp. NPDC096105]|uniref:RHS repeat domain-containing protein n=1 Tax=Streptomyces sp. NPDC096105 TaxID=3366074 RepID=UPI00382F02E9